MVKYLAKFERWSFGVHYLHLKNVGSMLLIIQQEITQLFLLMFDIKHKKHLFWINTFQIAQKNLRGDANITPLRVTARRREKYYTKQFSKVGRSAVGWLVWAKRRGNVWLTIGRWETVDSKIDLSILIDWLHGWRLPSLLSWSAVGWLVWAKRLGNVWLTIGWWETVDWNIDLSLLIDWLSIGRWETVDSKIDLSLLIDWLHGWRLPSLLSWSAVGWLVWAKRLGNVWLTAWLAASLLA